MADKLTWCCLVFVTFVLINQASGCFRRSKPNPPSCSCTEGNWGSWGSCFYGYQTRYRTTSPSTYSCSWKCGRNYESRCCLSCQYTSWSSWGSCYGGRRYRRRYLTSYPCWRYKCTGNTWESGDCCTKRDCVWNTWSAWTTCSSAGTRSRSRTQQAALCNGQACSGSSSETQTCIQNGCGTRQVTTTASISPAIGIGPTLVDATPVHPPGKWPWMVSIQRKTDSSHICGGALISDSWVVTAAHCYTSAISGIKAVFGGHNLKNPDSFVQSRDIIQFTQHPTYNVVYSPSFSIRDDIALIKLSSPVTYNTRIQPICLSTDRSGVTGCYVAGWGAQNSTFHGVGELLQETAATIVTQTACENKFGAWTTPGGIFCVDPHASAMICRGDSGGPMMCLGAGSGQYSLTGVVSFAYTNCMTVSDINGGLADVAKYVPWIRQTCLNCA